MVTMTATSLTRSDVIAAVHAAADRFISLVQDAPDLSVRVPDSPKWSIIDVFGHVVTVVPRYSKGPRHEGQWAERGDLLDAINADELSELLARDPAVLAAALRDSISELAKQINEYGDAQPNYRFHGGNQVAADQALGILLGELLIHGRDIAKVLHRPWPISAAMAGMVIDGITPIVPGWVDPRRTGHLTATFELRPRHTAPHIWSFSDGALTTDPVERPRIDVHISGDPTALLLVLYRRESKWRAIATGKLHAWGRRPWLAPTLANRFFTP